MTSIDWQEVVRILVDDLYLDLDRVLELAHDPKFEDFTGINDWRKYSDSLARDVSRTSLRRKAADFNAMNRHFLSRPIAERVAEVIRCQIKANEEEWD